MPNTAFSPVSVYGAGITHLFQIGLVMCYCILALVAVLVITATIKYRYRPGNEHAPQIHGNKWAERTWTVIPLLLLASMFSLTAITTKSSDPYVPRTHPDLIVIGHQWWWEFRYPNSGAVTSYEVHMPVGSRMATRIESDDVIHDFSVMQFGRKMDAIPGYPNYMWIDPANVGTYPGFCNEYCGDEHAWMQFRVIVQRRNDFEAWERHEASPAAMPVTDQEKYGARLFQQDSCASCHQIRGTDAKADVGPDLTHLAERKAIGSGVLTNTSEHLFAWLKNPQTIKPGVHMPDMQLNDTDTHALVAYLESLK
jgi:cytochrome c oxidase subunit II